MKKLWKFLTSMKFAVILLVILSLAMAGGSFITQNQSFEWYAAQYSERTAAVIFALGLDDIFHSWWFFALFAILCLDLLFCNVTKLPKLIRRAKASAKPKAGVFGPFVSHIGMLLLIIGFVLGQVTKEECTVYGFKGETKAVCDTGIQVTIEDFEVSFNEDDSVRQYTVSLQASDGEKSASGTASVNHPVKLLGYKFYQNSFGYTVMARVTKGGELLQEGRIIAGSGFRIPGNDNLSVVFNAFYPDYIFIDGSGPATQSGVMRNPGCLYTVYYGETVLGMNVLLSGERIKIDDYEVFLEDPGYYTILQVKRDSFVWLVFLGGIILLAGLFLSFYVKPLSLQNGEKQKTEPKEEQEVKENENASDH